MQQNSNTYSSSQIEELIMECKPFIERIAHRFVGKGPSLLDFDDYVSVGMIQIWQQVELILSAELPLAYATRTAQRAMTDEYNRLHKVLPHSLDVTIKSDSSFY